MWQKSIKEKKGETANEPYEQWVYALDTWQRLEKMHNLKIENYVLFEDVTEDCSLGSSFSDSSEGLFWRD